MYLITEIVTSLSLSPQARIIYEDYVSILSPREVSLDSRVREIINRNMIAPSQGRTNERRTFRRRRRKNRSKRAR